MARISVKKAAADARREDAKLRKELVSAVTADKAQSVSGVPTADSFLNFSHKLGVGADNMLTSSTYGFNPISRNRTMLEWIHRGSWLGGVAVDVVADDMTRAGCEYTTELPPDVQEIMDRRAISLNTWPSIAAVIQWGRLYGGGLGVLLIDGQDMRTPLRLNTVGPHSYKGLLVLDRWMVEPSLEDLVTELGPHLGLPRYYRVQANAPALRGVSIHHSRIAFRHVGISLPYQQQLMENLWGISVLERLYDRMLAFDSATTGAAQLVHKSYLRTLSVDGLRDIVAAGGRPLDGLSAYVDMMRRFQGIEGITMVDVKDKFETQGHSAFSGLSDALVQFGQQLAGALQIPLVRLFGQSPAGLNATGESDMRMYYDHINQQQQRTLYHGVNLVYKLIALSEGVKLPPNFAVGFKSLWQLTDGDKANVAKTIADTVQGASEAGLITQKVALQELRQSSRITGVFTNITHDQIEQADDTLQPPGAQDLLSGLTGGGGEDGGGAGELPPGGVAPGQLPGQADSGAHGVTNGNANGPQGTQGKVDQGQGGRKPLQLPTPQRRPTSRGPGQGPGA